MPTDATLSVGIDADLSTLERQLEELRKSIKPKGIWAPKQVMQNQIIQR